jgi:hypothetical protein
VFDRSLPGWESGFVWYKTFFRLRTALLRLFYSEFPSHPFWGQDTDEVIVFARQRRRRQAILRVQPDFQRSAAEPAGDPFSGKTRLDPGLESRSDAASSHLAHIQKSRETEKTYRGKAIGTSAVNTLLRLAAYRLLASAIC